MSIRISKEACVGCLACTRVCPGSLIKEKDGKAFIKYSRDCWGCASCVKECGFGAIDFYLGADMGGNGTVMNVSEHGDLFLWKVTRPDGTVRIIEVNGKNSNKY